MASMKDYLEKAMLRLGSNAGMPGTYSIEIANKISTYVAPADGFVKVSTPMDTSNSQTFWLEDLNSGADATHWLPLESHVSATLPVAKGHQVKLSVPDSSGRVFFIKTLGALGGGGLKRLIQKVFYLGGRYGFA